MANNDISWDRINRARNVNGYDEMIDFYNNWAGTYDHDTISTEYLGPKICASYFNKHAEKLGFTKTSKILDACAGAGLVTQEILNMGYTNIDGHDGSEEMLKKGMQLNRFKNTYCNRIGDGYQLPVEDNAYDAVVMSGALAPNYIKCDAFLELFRIVRKGGLIVNTTRTNALEDVPEYQQLPELIESWSKSGLISILEIAFPEEKYHKDTNPVVHVFKVL